MIQVAKQVWRGWPQHFVARAGRQRLRSTRKLKPNAMMSDPTPWQPLGTVEFPDALEPPEVPRARLG